MADYAKNSPQSQGEEQVTLRAGVPQHIGELLAEYFSTSQDSLASSFRAHWGHLHPFETTVELPHKNNYVELVAYIQSEKKRGVDWYKISNYNRTKLCGLLSPIVGWVIDSSTLGRAEIRVFHSTN